MSGDVGDWQRLAEVMDLRRAELGLKWDDVAIDGGVSVATLRRMRRGNAITTDNATAAERGLRWRMGSIRAVLAGGLPSPMESGERAPMASTAEANRASILSATSEQLVEMRQVVEDVLGAEMANRWLTGALEMRAAVRQPGSDRTRRPS
jgi:hypothetical protein